MTVGNEQSTLTRRTITRRSWGPYVFTNHNIQTDVLSFFCLYRSFRLLRFLRFFVLLHVDLLLERIKTVVLAVDLNGGVAGIAQCGVVLAGIFLSSRPLRKGSGGQ